MPEGKDPAALRRLRDEVARLEKINAALVARAEAVDARLPSDFGVFQATVLLEDQVRNRTQELQAALHRLEEANRALRISQATFRAVFELMPEPVTLSKVEDGTLLEVSRSYAEFFGYQPEEMVGRRTSPDDLGIWADSADRARYLAAIAAGNGVTAGFASSVRRADAEIAQVLLSGRIIEVEGQRLLLTEFHDVTEATRHADRLQQIAEQDALTGLPNRRRLLQRLEQAVEEARRGGWMLAVCYVDLDGFKTVNDTLGHRAGDRVLLEAARRLAAGVRASDTVGRLGGDEFAILLPGLSGRGGCDEVLRRALETLAAPYPVDAEMVTGVSATIGVTLFPEDDSSAEVLLHHADEAMYCAKRAGRNRCCSYVPGASGGGEMRKGQPEVGPFMSGGS